MTANKTIEGKTTSTDKIKPIILCHYPWTSLYVSPNGDVKHCCSTNLSKLGNLTTQSIDEIWNGELFKTIREKISIGDFEGHTAIPTVKD